MRRQLTLTLVLVGGFSFRVHADQTVTNGSCVIQISGNNNVAYNGCGDRSEQLRTVLRAMKEDVDGKVSRATKGQMIDGQYQERVDPAVAAEVQPIANLLSAATTVGGLVCELDYEFSGLKFFLLANASRGISPEEASRRASELSQQLQVTVMQLNSSRPYFPIDTVRVDIGKFMEKYRDAVHGPLDPKEGPLKPSLFSEVKEEKRLQVRLINQAMLNITDYFACPDLFQPFIPGR